MYQLPPTTDMSEFVAAVERVCHDARISAVVPLADEILGSLIRGTSADARWTLVGPDHETFQRVCDKAQLLATAAAAGVASPVSAVVTADGLQGEQPPFPAYVKVVGGADEGRPAGRPVRVTDQSSFEQAIERLVVDGRAALVQEEIEGEQWRFHFVRHGGRIVHLSARTLGNYPFRVGVSTVSQYTFSPPELADVGSRLLDHLGYEGTGVLQFVSRDGVLSSTTSICASRRA